MKKRFPALVGAGLFMFAQLTQVMAADAPDSTDIIKIAEEYLVAYSTFQPEKMAPYYADDAVFLDPTSTTQTADGGPFFFDGKEAILQGLGDYAAQYNDFSVHYDVERQYESNGVVVFIAQLTYNAISKKGQTFTGAAPIVTVIEVKNAKVARHTDYYDYAGNAVEMQP